LKDYDIGNVTISITNIVPDPAIANILNNQTSNEPVLKMSSDGGKTFGPLIKLANNGTIGTGEAKPLLP
jgi:hypothetical protein